MFGQELLLQSMKQILLAFSPNSIWQGAQEKLSHFLSAKLVEFSFFFQAQTQLRSEAKRRTQKKGGEREKEAGIIVLQFSFLIDATF